MRHSIARAISACLRTLFAVLLPAKGKHRSPEPVEAPAPPEPYVSPWSRPWTSPSKAEAAALFRQQDAVTLELRLQQERRRAAALASMGIEYPYTYEGAPFGPDAFAATEMSA
ncbi:hypothetical protein ACVNF4_10470 [Streptomyces sp. S6]